MKFAVHNYHTPAIEIIDGDPRTINLSEALHVADTFEDAEAWRKANVPFVAEDRATTGHDRNR